MAVRIYNGVSEHGSWSCIGYKLTRVLDYAERVKQLPRLASTGLRSKRARIGRNVVTFTAEATRPERKSFFYSDATGLADVLALWSFIGGLTVMKSHSDRWPTSDDLTFKLASSYDTAASVAVAYKKIVLRQPKDGVRSAMLVYLEIPHVRTVEVKAALITTVLECLTPIRAPADAPERGRYKPIIQRLRAIKVLPDNASKRKVEDLVVALYKIRNDFAHAGAASRLSETLLQIGSLSVEPRRVVNACRHLCKLVIAEEVAVPLDTGAAENCSNILRFFFQNGTFMPGGRPR